MQADPDTLKQEIFDELCKAAAHAKRCAVRNYFCAYTVSGIIVVSSVTAGLLVGVDRVPNEIKAALASLPAVMLTASTVFRFEQKSAWFWKKAKALEALIRKMKYESSSAAEASRQFSELEERMEQDWVPFGTQAKGHG